MNKTAQEELQRIAGLQVEELSEAETAFLRARRSYLSADEAAKFESVLESAEDKKPSEKKSKS